MVASLIVALAVGACSSNGSTGGASHTATTKTCTGNAQNVQAPELPAADGISSLPGMTKITSGTAPLSGAKDGYVPALDCSYTPVGSLGQLWVMTAAIEHYGSGARVPLPIPLDFASTHTGPGEVNVTVLAFGGTAQPRALLTNPEFSTGVGWTKLPGAAIHDGNTFRIDSAANDGQDDFLLQWASDTRWTEVSILGAGLTIEHAQRVAESVGSASG